jgi:hypothetical protein
MIAPRCSPPPSEFRSRRFSGLATQHRLELRDMASLDRMHHLRREQVVGSDVGFVPA